jgi:flavodoxin
METMIFYFSATGNSLAVARSIADGLGNTELVSIPQAMENHKAIQYKGITPSDGKRHNPQVAVKEMLLR